MYFIKNGTDVIQTSRICMRLLRQHNLTSGSAMVEGLRNALVSRNSATTKHPI